MFMNVIVLLQMYSKWDNYFNDIRPPKFLFWEQQ